MADFFWCMMAPQRGWSVEQTANKLLEVSDKAQERARLRDEGYALITAQNAAAAAERGKQRGRGLNRLVSRKEAASGYYRVFRRGMTVKSTSGTGSHL